MKQLQLQREDGDERMMRAGTTESRRIAIERKVILKFHHFGGFFIEYSANMSLAGMFIKTEQPKPPGSVFIFEVWLGDEYKLVHGVGEVVWTRAEDEGGDRPAGMGIRFLKIDEESRAVIERVIGEHVQKGGKVFDLEAAAAGRTTTTERPLDPEPAASVATDAAGGDLLIIDEELLGGEPAAEEQPVTRAVPIVTSRPARGLQIALLLAILAAALGGAAYLYSAGMLPF